MLCLVLIVLCRRVVCHGCVGFERVNVNWCGVVFLLCLYSDAGLGVRSWFLRDWFFYYVLFLQVCLIVAALCVPVRCAPPFLLLYRHGVFIKEEPWPPRV